MGWLKNLRINRAAKRYAAQLPPALQGSIGAQQFYTSCQIKTAVKALGLNRNYIALGYAWFLPEERFHTMTEEMRVPLRYDAARALMARYLPPN